MQGREYGNRKQGGHMECELGCRLLLVRIKWGYLYAYTERKAAMATTTDETAEAKRRAGSSKIGIGSVTQKRSSLSFRAQFSAQQE